VLYRFVAIPSSLRTLRLCAKLPPPPCSEPPLTAITDPRRRATEDPPRGSWGSLCRSRFPRRGAEAQRKTRRIYRKSVLYRFVAIPSSLRTLRLCAKLPPPPCSEPPLTAVTDPRRRATEDPPRGSWGSLCRSSRGGFFYLQLAPELTQRIAHVAG
jgi:hypothetical protein